jgi:hypothetical protein
MLDQAALADLGLAHGHEEAAAPGERALRDARGPFELLLPPDHRRQGGVAGRGTRLGEDLVGRHGFGLPSRSSLVPHPTRTVRPPPVWWLRR